MAKADKEDKFIMTILLIAVLIFVFILLAMFTAGYISGRQKAMINAAKAKQNSQSQQFKDLQQMYH